MKRTIELRVRFNFIVDKKDLIESADVDSYIYLDIPSSQIKLKGEFFKEIPAKFIEQETMFVEDITEC
jgi:hypothetical protein